MLRLPTIRARFADSPPPSCEQLSHLRFLSEQVIAERDDRTRRRAERHIRDPAFHGQNGWMSLPLRIGFGLMVL